MKILIAEDQSILASQIQKLLRKQKFSADIVLDGETADNYLGSTTYDLLILDLGLPKVDGITLCERLRSQGKAIPILMLTGHNKIQDRLRGLNAGGDDYLTKPFDSNELIARVHALLRRQQLDSQPILSWGNLSLNQNLQQIYYKNTPLNLTATEHRIMALLLLNPNHVFSRQMLIDRIWSSTREIPGDETVKSHIKTIRRKLQKINLENLVKTIYGVGYCLNREFRDLLLKSSSLESQCSDRPEKIILKKSVVIYDKDHTLKDITPSSLNLERLTSDLLPDISFNVDITQCSNISSLKDQIKCHAFDLLLVLFDATDDCQKMFEKLQGMSSDVTSFNWFFVTKKQLLQLTASLDDQDDCPIENNASSLSAYHQNIADLLAKSHAKLRKKVQIFVFSECKFILDIVKLLSENSRYIVTVVNAFEEIWDCYNVASPIVVLMDAKVENFTGIRLCRMLRSNVYFNHIPIAMVGDHSPYILDEIMPAGVDYFIDRSKIATQIHSFSDWIDRKFC